MRSCSTASRLRSRRRGSPGCGPRSWRWSISHRVVCTEGERAGLRSGTRRHRVPLGGRDRRRRREPRRRPARRRRAARPDRRGAPRVRRPRRERLAARPSSWPRGLGALRRELDPHKGFLELLDVFATLPEEAATLWLVGATDADPRYAERVRRRVAAPDFATGSSCAIRSGRGGRPVLPMGRRVRTQLVRRRVRHGVGRGDRGGPSGRGWRAGNLPRLAEHGREALMAEPGDLAGLASALRAIVTDDVLRARLAAGARGCAATLPTWRDSAQLFFASFRELLSRPPCARCCSTSTGRSGIRRRPCSACSATCTGSTGTS